MKLLNRRILGLGCWLVFASCLPGQGAHAQGAPHAAPVGAAATEATSRADKGITLFKAHRYAEAKAALSSALATDPKDAEAHAYLGMALNNYDRDVDQAIVHLEEAVKLDPQRSRYHQWLGGVYGGKAGSVSILKAPSYARKCREEMEAGVRLDPADVEAHQSLMQFYIAAPGFIGGSMAKARDEAALITKLDPVQGLYAEAALANYEKDTAKVEALYRKAVVEAPAQGLPYNYLAYFLLKAKRTDEAVSTFRLYVQAAPSDPNAHDSLAEGLLAQGQVEEALAEYKRALGLDPYFSSSCLGLAQCYTRKAQGSQARDAYQRYLVLVPKGRSADDARKKIESLQKKQA